MHYIITEKNTTAKRISAILSNGETRTKKIGRVEAYEFEGKVVMGLRGHVVTLDFPPEYNDWSKINPYELINAELMAVPLRKDIVASLEHIAKDASRVTLATDYDREGELIGVEALNVIKRVNPGIKSVDRMRYSAITEPAIKDSFKAISEIDYNLAAAGEAREIIDLVWGASLTRFVSLTANCLGDNFLSVGRVQSPTLTLLVNKEKEIANFVPRKYWEIQAKIRGEKGEVFDVTHERGRIWEKEDADKIKSSIETINKGEVRAVEVVMRKEKPPTPFDTTEFIRAASNIGYLPKKAMNIAESLYLRGLISYHRTDNTVYPETLDVRGLVKMFLQTDQFGEHASRILKKKKLKPTAGKKKTTDHPPIHPVAAVSPFDLKEDEVKIYELVVRRFFATLSEDAKWENTTIKVAIGEEILEGKGKELKKAGWLSVYPYQKREQKILPKLKVGEEVSVEHCEAVEKVTKPPNRFSHASLIKKMEDLGLGTKSTRHEIISKLEQRMYVHGNPVRPTKKAFAITDSLQKYASMIAEPDMTSVLEEEMNGISERKLKKEEVVERSKEMLTKVFQEMMDNEGEIAKSLKEGLRGDKTVGACPECGSDLILMRSKKNKRFVGCSNYPTCSFSLPLPQSGRLLVTPDKCDKHPFLFKIKIKIRGKNKMWAFGCPYCNFLRWEEEKKKDIEK